jgi:hypothetical protein
MTYWYSSTFQPKGSGALVVIAAYDDATNLGYWIATANGSVPSYGDARTKEAWQPNI